MGVPKMDGLEKFLLKLMIYGGNPILGSLRVGINMYQGI